MKIAFLILAHDRPEQVAELARTLVGAAADGVAFVHYDVRSPADDFARLAAAVAGEPRIRLVAERVAGRWGSFGLVEAPLNALAEIEAAGVEGGIEPDYVILLSGACLPCRPVAALERYLAENAGREFIEVADKAWIGNGWRDERWQYRFWFDHKTQHGAEWLSFQTQRLLGLRRRFPAGLEPRFGSQWWALTWDTCRAMLLDMARDPARLDFFRTVWIPDEMVIQTWVAALVQPDEIAGHGLTHFQFTNRGKPVVFHDDHLDYVPTLDGFFVRKVSPRAARLRAACLAVAAAPDDGAPFGPIGPRRGDYRMKVVAQTYYPGPGQIFYASQRVEESDSVLANAETPYVVVLGPPKLTAAVAAALPDRELLRLGAVFGPAEVDLGREAGDAPQGPPRTGIGGLARTDTAIRDMHPALFLARLRARCAAVPVLTWSPFHAPGLLAAVLRDPSALVVACLPFTGDAERDRRLLVQASRGDAGLARVPESAFDGIDPGRVARARLDCLAEAGGAWLDWLGHDLFYLIQDETSLHRSAMISMPWTPVGSLNALQRRQMFEASLASCRFVSSHWYRGLARGLRQVWDERFEAGTDALLGPLSAVGAALFEATEVRPRPDRAAAPGRAFAGIPAGTAAETPAGTAAGTPVETAAETAGGGR